MSQALCKLPHPCATAAGWQQDWPSLPCRRGADVAFRPQQELSRGVCQEKSVVRDRVRKYPVRCGIAEPEGKPAPFGQKTRYNDSWFDQAFMGLFRRKMEKATGKGSKLEGYDGFVDVSRSIMRGRTPQEQQDAVAGVLLSIMPPNAPAQFRKLFPPNKFSCEINAAITPPFFAWLVGPSEVVEVEINGEKWKSGVKVQKCRYLENSGCVGMCVNMCKLPTQNFFTNEFGLPLTMKPNFEDMSCEMIFGQAPPPIAEDEVSKQPCFATMCTMAQAESIACPKIAAD